MAKKRTRNLRASVFLAAALASSVLLHATAGPGDGASASAFSDIAAIPAATAPAHAGSTSITPAPAVTYAPSGDATPDPVPDRDLPTAIEVPHAEQLASTVANVPFTTAVDCGGYMCQVRLDIYVPTGPGPYPTLVLLRGGPGGMGARSYLANFATAVAETGILVFSADYRDSPVVGGGYPQAFADASCAVRFARTEASKYGGDSSTVTVAGHSLGGWVGSVISLGAREFTGGCLDASGSGRPDAFVGLSGCYDLSSSSVASEMSFFFANQPASARTASDPLKIALGSPIPVRLVAGTADGSVYPTASVMLNTMLAGRGWDTALTMVPGGVHSSILWTDYLGGSFAAIFTAISKADAIWDINDAAAPTPTSTP